MKNKMILSFFALQFITLPCISMEEEAQENNELSQQVQTEQEDKTNHIFLKDEEPVTFTPRALYQAACSGEKRAQTLLEYLGEMYSPTFLRQYELDSNEFNLDDQKNIDKQYTLPVSHFTQKLLDQPLWDINVDESGLEDLIRPKPIQNGSTHNAIRILEKILNNENFQEYFSKKEGRSILKKMSLEAAKILEDQKIALQDLNGQLESEKAQYQQLTNEKDSAISDLTSKLENLQEEQLKLAAEVQEKNTSLENIRADNQLLGTENKKLTEELEENKLQHLELAEEHKDALLNIKSLNLLIEKLRQENSMYLEMIKQASAILTPKE